MLFVGNKKAKKRTRNFNLNTHPIFLAAPDAATAILELMDAITMPYFVYMKNTIVKQRTGQ